MTKRWFEKKRDSLGEGQLADLSAYVDGEVVEAKARAIEHCIYEGDGKLRSELESLRRLRGDIRGYFSAELDEERTRHGELDVWRSIESRLEKEEGKRQSLEAGRAMEAVSKMGRGIVESFRGFRAPAFAAAGVAMLALLSVVTVRNSSGRATAERQLVLNSEKRDLDNIPGTVGPNMDLEIRLAQRSLPVNEGLRLRPEGRREWIPADGSVNHSDIPAELLIPVSDGERSGSLKSVPWSLNLEMPSLSIEQSDPGPGLVAFGVDFEWIRSDRAFDIVPARSASAPPVIWVASR